MAVSLELRVPMLDHTLVEYAASLPHHAKLRGLRTKYLLRKAAENLLPKAILKRPKQGFELPIASWLGRELRDPMHDLLLAAPARERGVFRPHAVDEILQRHTSGRENLSGQIWAMMALEAWFRQQVDMASPPAEALQPVP